MVIAYITRGEEHKLVDGWLNEATRKKLAGKVLERLNKVEIFRKQETHLAEIIEAQAKNLYRLIMGKTSNYKPYVAKW